LTNCIINQRRGNGGSGDGVEQQRRERRVNMWAAAAPLLRGLSAQLAAASMKRQRNATS